MTKLYQLRVNTADIKYCGTEPQWSTLSAADPQRQLLIIRAFNWYNYVCTSDDRRKFLQDWIAQAGQKEKWAAAVRRAADKDLNPTACHLARMSCLGLQLTGDEYQLITRSIAALDVKNPAIEKTSIDLPASTRGASRKNPAARSAEVAHNVKEQVEDAIIDLLYDGSTTVKPAHIVQACTRTQASTLLVAELVQQKQAQFKQLLVDRTQQRNSELQESYRNVLPANLDATIKWIKELSGALDTAKSKIDTKKSKKVRKVDPARLVSKLVYLKEHKDLGLVSIDPQQCIGATVVWTYSVKTRKLTMYQAVADQTISIKSQTLTNVDTTASLQKTLKKPKSQLADFLQTGSRRLKNWFDQINTMPHRPTPRLNENTIILKAIR